jgi:hypothetical protein
VVLAPVALGPEPDGPLSGTAAFEPLVSAP